MIYKINTLDDTKKVAQTLVTQLNDHKVICLYGDLGSGKTTFTKFLLEALGSESRVQSPTYIILKTYRGSGSYKSINHLDLYRLKTSSDLIELDIESLISDPHSLTIIEWPELAEPHLPKNFVKIYLEDSNGERTMDVQITN